LPEIPHTRSMPMNREEMLDRSMASDSDFDGVFITGVLSTGIYCLPSCRARKPKPENIRFFSSIEEARSVGLRACKKCCPDDFFAGIDLDLEALESVIRDLKCNPQRFTSIGDLATAMNVGNSKLFLSVRKHFHSTPGELIAQSRVNKSCDELLRTDSSVSELAFKVGFETLSTFYDHFGRLTGMAPTAYRRLRHATSFKITLPKNYQADVLLKYFGRDPESVSEKVDGRELWASINGSGLPAVLHLSLGDDTVECEFSGIAGVDAHRAVVRMLGLAQDPAGFEYHINRLGEPRFIEGRSGIRIPQTVTNFDGFVWAILGQQVNLHFAYSLRRRLIQLAGTRVSDRLVAPPLPRDVARLNVDDLLQLQFSLRKAEYLIGVSRKIDEGELNLEEMENGSASRAEKTLMAVRGFGPWSSNYVMMRSFGFADCLPVGDTGLTLALQRYFQLDKRPQAAETKALMERFSPFRSLASMHLWQSLKIES